MKNELNGRELIIDALNNYGGTQRNTGDSRFIICPFHDDKNPSCGVFLGVGMNIPLGYFHCLGCLEKGPWNKLAKKAGFSEIPYWKTKEGSINDQMIGNELLAMDYSFSGLIKTLGNPPYIPWPENVAWRGFSGKLIKKIGGYLIDDRQMKLLLPVKIMDKIYGGVTAYLNKQINGLSYITSKGNWVKSTGLFPYNYTRTMINKYELNYVVLVEGPRDALRLLNNKIPALAILGAKNFNEKKAMLILALNGIEKIYIFPDMDEGGRIMDRTVRINIEKFILTQTIGFSNISKNYDPANIPQKYIEKLKRKL